jgi:hypothetical protein
MVAPYAHLLHMKVGKHLVNVWQGCAIHFGCVLCLITCVMGKVCSPAVTQDFCLFPKSGLAPAVITQWRWFHISNHCIWRLKIHLACVYQGCVIHFGWVLSLIACVMDKNCNPAVTQDFCWFPKSWLAPAMIMQWWWHHMHIHCIWKLANILHMSDKDVWSMLGGSWTSFLAYW